MFKFDFEYDDYERLLKRCPFTDEEKEIFHLRRRGKSRVQISIALGMSESAVDRRVASIMKKIKKEI